MSGVQSSASPGPPMTAGEAEAASAKPPNRQNPRDCKDRQIADLHERKGFVEESEIALQPARIGLHLPRYRVPLKYRFRGDR